MTWAKHYSENFISFCGNMFIISRKTMQITIIKHISSGSTKQREQSLWVEICGHQVLKQSHFHRNWEIFIPCDGVVCDFLCLWIWFEVTTLLQINFLPCWYEPFSRRSIDNQGNLAKMIAQVVMIKWLNMYSDFSRIVPVLILMDNYACIVHYINLYPVHVSCRQRLPFPSCLLNMTLLLVSGLCLTGISKTLVRYMGPWWNHKVKISRIKPIELVHFIQFNFEVKGQGHTLGSSMGAFPNLKKSYFLNVSPIWHHWKQSVNARDQISFSIWYGPFL